VKFLHVPVPLHLGLVPVDTSFGLASEGKQILVNELGCEAVASMSLGSLDVMVDLVLCLETLRAALIRAWEWSLSCVVHQVQFELLHRRIAHRAARIGAWMARPLGSVMAEDVPPEMTSLGESCSTVSLLTGEGAETQMNLIHMPLQMLGKREGETTCDALVGLLYQMDSLEVSLHIAKSVENLAAGWVSARITLAEMQ